MICRSLGYIWELEGEVIVKKNDEEVYEPFLDV